MCNAVNDTPAPVKVACPECGSEHGIYARADIRWQALTQSWEIADIEAELECTDCDHAWAIPDDWPRPIE